jgi:hypothetical protein
LIGLLKRNDKVYFQDNDWIVYLNNRNNIKVLCLATETIYDYFKDISGKNTVPTDIRKKCVEIHEMWHNGSIWHWLDEQRKNAERKKAKGEK